MNLLKSVAKASFNYSIMGQNEREKCLVLKGFQTQDKNTHLEHLEDDIINRGAEGERML